MEFSAANLLIFGLHCWSFLTLKDKTLFQDIVNASVTVFDWIEKRNSGTFDFCV